jgi:disulfide bond formation protein DsbB
MKCHDVRAILSAYHDAEVPTDQQIVVEVHLESCSECAARLAEIRRLSHTASTLPQPTPPRQLWKKVEGALKSGTDLRSSGWSRRWWRSPAALIAAVAFLLLAAGLGIYFDRQDHTNHDYLADYWQKFETDPRKAQQQLLARYSGQVVSDNEAVRQVGYRPLTSAQVPEDVAVEKTYVLDMPCCKCIQTVCCRADGTVLAVFEHTKEQPGWFHSRPHVQMQSGGASCRVTELDVHLAASWQAGRRTVTIVGLRNVEELSQWVHSLNPASIKSHSRSFHQ